MALLNQSVQVYGQLENLFNTLRQGQAPSKFTREFLRDMGFKSSNFHAVIPLLKGLGFLASDGSPTQRYKEFLDPTRWKKMVAEGVREAYSDLFVIKSKPTKSDRNLIAGKYKSTYNLSETAADRAARTFLALLDLCDPDVLYGSEKVSAVEEAAATEAEPTEAAPPAEAAPMATEQESQSTPASYSLGLRYNIQIHLPATKDVEVYNAIFKSIREHLLD